MHQACSLAFQGTARCTSAYRCHAAILHACLHGLVVERLEYGYVPASLPHCGKHNLTSPPRGPPRTVSAVLALLVAEVGPAGARARRAEAAAKRVAVPAPVGPAVPGRPARRLPRSRARVVLLALRACMNESLIAA